MIPEQNRAVATNLCPDRWSSDDITISTRSIPSVDGAGIKAARWDTGVDDSCREHFGVSGGHNVLSVKLAIIAQYEWITTLDASLSTMK